MKQIHYNMKMTNQLTANRYPSKMFLSMIVILLFLRKIKGGFECYSINVMTIK